MDEVQDMLQKDQYNLFVPIEKSVSVDENGDYIVEGVMTSDDVDEEDDTITPEGMDCSYFLEKGWIKYEHGKNPDQFIGEPLEVRVGKFDHPTLLKSVNGIYVKGRLFAKRALTKQAIEAMDDLQKSHTKRRMGWSIEGNVVKRHPKSGKIIKSVLRNVVLTMNPVNTTTWAELAKSFAKDHEIIIDTEGAHDEAVLKAMDLEGAQAIAKQSLEGADKKKDPQQEWIDLFRGTVKRAFMEKSLGSPDEVSILAFTEALHKGMDYIEAESFATYIEGKQPLLKAMAQHFGGEKMSNEAENKLATLLDADLEELKKALAMDEEDSDDSEETEDDGIEKSFGEGSDEGAEEGAEEDSEDGESEEEEEDDEEGEEVEKSFRTGLTKSLSEEHGQAFEVSDFLTAITDEIGFSLEGMEKSLGHVTKTQNTLVKALSGFGEIMQKAIDKIDTLEADNAELQKSLESMLNRPIGRKGIVNQREYQTLTKSLDGGTQPNIRMSRNQISDELVKSFQAGEISGSVVTKFEAGVPLARLNLPDHLLKSFGL